jgi:hypothetical protein
LKQRKNVEEMDLGMQKPVKVVSIEHHNSPKSKAVEEPTPTIVREESTEHYMERMNKKFPNGPPGQTGVNPNSPMTFRKGEVKERILWQSPAKVTNANTTSTSTKPKAIAVQKRRTSGRKPDRRGIPKQCPKCNLPSETALRKNGTDPRYGQKYLCHECGCSFTTKSGVYLKWKVKQDGIRKRLATMKKKGQIK